MSLIQSIISKFLVIQSKFCFKSNFHVIRSLHIRIYIVVWMYIKGHVKTVDTKDQSNAIVYWVWDLFCQHCQYKDQSTQCIECYVCWGCWYKGSKQCYCVLSMVSCLLTLLIQRSKHAMHQLNIKEVMTQNLLTMSKLLIQLKSPDSELSKTSNRWKIGWILRKIWAKMYWQCQHCRYSWKALILSFLKLQTDWKFVEY